MLVSLALGFTFLNIPPLGRQFMALLDIGYDGLSWVLSGMLWAHALSQIPAGLVADRIGPWTTMMAGLSICILANLCPFLDPRSLPLAVGMRFCLGVGASLSLLGAMKTIYLLTPSDQLTRVQGLQGAGFSFGFVLPYLILPRLGPTAWPFAYLGSAFFLMAAMGAAFFLPRRKLKPPKTVKTAAEIRRAIFSIISSPAIWALGLIHGLSYGSLNNLGNWLPSILADLDGRGNPEAWALAATLLLLLGTFSRAFSSQIFYRAPRNLVVSRSVLVIVSMYLIMGLAGQRYFVLGAALLMALACGANYGGLFTMTAGAFEAAYAATAVGVMNTIANLFNVGITLFLGYVRQYSGGFGPSLLALAGAGFLLWLFGRGAIRRLDQKMSKAA